MCKHSARPFAKAIADGMTITPRRNCVVACYYYHTTIIIAFDEQYERDGADAAARAANSSGVRARLITRLLTRVQH